eukprot:scaffold586522_cov14-Prasinocladus_malaysianus.AAC.1
MRQYRYEYGTQRDRYLEKKPAQLPLPPIRLLFETTSSGFVVRVQGPVFNLLRTECAGTEHPSACAIIGKVRTVPPLVPT